MHLQTLAFKSVKMGNDGLFSICLSLKWAICGTYMYYVENWCVFFMSVCTESVC